MGAPLFLKKFKKTTGGGVYNITDYTIKGGLL